MKKRVWLVDLSQNVKSTSHPFNLSNHMLTLPNQPTHMQDKIYV